MADSFDRVIASGKEAFSSASTKLKGNSPNTWEAMLNDGVAEPYTLTAAALKAKNGRSGPQAGA